MVPLGPLSGQRDVDVVLGWGLRPSAARARRYAARHRLPYWALEDGFLRSLQLGRTDAPLSVVVDDLGIYYDARRASRLEELIGQPLSAAEQTRTAALIAAWRAGRVSKYNFQRNDPGPLPERFVLAVDQTRGDASIRFGIADAKSFARMLAAALAEQPDCTVLVKLHPEVLAGRKHGHFDLDALRRMPRVALLGDDVHPVALLERAEAVYTVTSQVGFEALLWDRPVRCFGMPFYAGWGLTRDELPAPARRARVGFAQLACAALIKYPRYRDPETGLRCEAEVVLAHLALQRKMRVSLPAEVYALGFSPWKRPLVRRFLQGSALRFVRRPSAVPEGATLAVWGRRDLPPQTGERVDVLRLEDGFLRSVGLGADLVRPLSWVADARGIYYDATRPSDLEDLLEEAHFDAALLERAARLRERIVAEGLTKYNVGAGRWRRPPRAARVLLVPGQVEGDASIRYGAGAIRTNLALLEAVRRARPDAYLVYKPHPDVLARIRARGADEERALRECDEHVTDVGMAQLLAEVDEVHTLTSLAGFEALLRGKKVVCYGQPFYAGWGLTEDTLPPARRSRNLSLDMLVAATLILYPRYVSRSTGRYTSPERALDELLAWRASQSGALPAWRRVLRLALRFSSGRR